MTLKRIITRDIVIQAGSQTVTFKDIPMPDVVPLDSGPVPERTHLMIQIHDREQQMLRLAQEWSALKARLGELDIAQSRIDRAARLKDMQAIAQRTHDHFVATYKKV